MPWRGESYPGEFPSLGWLVGEWIEEHCVIPDQDHAGDPFKLTDEMWTFLVHHYRLRRGARPGKPSAAWQYRESLLVRPQKWGKGPFSAAIVCAESVGPVLFDGWDADGEPVGRPWATPHIQITASTDDQAANVYRALQPMIELGPLADVIPDTGLTRINLPGGGLIEPVTSKARSRLGARITFALQDETGTWTSSGLVDLADTQRRGLAGMGGRSIGTTNAWDPAERSVAQQVAEAGLRDVHVDHRQPPAGLSYTDKRDRRKIHRHVYGDSWWVDLDYIEGLAAQLLKRDPRQPERFFGNRIVAGSRAWLEPQVWSGREAPRRVPDGTRICLGFDGSDTDDWTGIRAETLDGYQFTPTYHDGRPTIWDPAAHGGRVPRLEVAAAVEELFERYDVVRGYFDPPFWQSEIDGWDARWPGRVFRWETYRTTQVHHALERLKTDLTSDGDALTHDACEHTAVHVRNAVESPRQGGRYVLTKPSDHQKIDLAMCSVLAHEAVGDAIASGAMNGQTDSYAYVM